MYSSLLPPPPHDRKPLSWHWKCWEPFLCQNNSFRACFSEDLLTNVLKTRILQHNEAPPLLSLTQKCAQNSFLLQNASFEQWSVLSPEATLWCYSSFHLWAPAPNCCFLCYFVLFVFPPLSHIMFWSCFAFLQTLFFVFFCDRILCCVVFWFNLFGHPQWQLKSIAQI